MSSFEHIQRTKARREYSAMVLAYQRLVAGSYFREFFSTESFKIYFNSNQIYMNKAILLKIEFLKLISY